MAWRFRKTFRLFPGVRLNLSKGGLSLSVGGAPATLNIGPRGPRATFGVPGSGVSVSVPLAVPRGGAGEPTRSTIGSGAGSSGTPAGSSTVDRKAPTLSTMGSFQGNTCVATVPAGRWTRPSLPLLRSVEEVWR